MTPSASSSRWRSLPGIPSAWRTSTSSSNVRAGPNRSAREQSPPIGLGAPTRPSHPVRLGEQAPDLGLAAHVRGHRRGLAARVPDPAGHPAERVAVACGQHHVSARGRDGLRGGRPDPAAGPRDHRDPSAQPVRCVLHWLTHRQLAGRAAREHPGFGPGPAGSRRARDRRAGKGRPPAGSRRRRPGRHRAAPGNRSRHP